jgi:hypothetical protein
MATSADRYVSRPDSDGLRISRLPHRPGQRQADWVKNDQSKINMLQAEGRDTRAAKALLHSDPVQLEVDERASSRMARRTVVLANSNRKGKSLPTTLGSSLRQVFGRS